MVDTVSKMNSEMVVAEPRSIATPETASSSVAAQARASIEARYAIALRFPRDLDDVRVRLIADCKRPGFAEIARYRKPISKGVEGFSIRFAEAALRAMRNVAPEMTTLYDDESKRIVRVSVTDLESNLTYSSDVVIDKVVERSQLRDGQVPLKVRTNSQGKTTYLVAATEDDLLNKQGALVSKAMRTHALRILPGDIQDECEAVILATLGNKAAADPRAEQKKLADAFASVGVKPSQLKDYLGHELEACAAEELVNLRALFQGLKDGETTWAEITKPVPATAPTIAPDIAAAVERARGVKRDPGQ